MIALGSTSSVPSSQSTLRQRVARPLRDPAIPPVPTALLAAGEVLWSLSDALRVGGNAVDRGSELVSRAGHAVYGAGIRAQELYDDLREATR